MNQIQTVSTVSKNLGISSRMLRYYEQVGLIKSQRVDGYAYRVYDETAIKRLQQIVILRKLQIPVKQIKEILNNQDAVAVIEIFEQNISALDEQITALSTVKTILRRFVDELQEKADVHLKLDLLADKTMFAVMSALSFSENKIKEKVSMDELNKANETIAKLQERKPACVMFQIHQDAFWFLGNENIVDDESDYGYIWDNFFKMGGYDKIAPYAIDLKPLNVWYTNEKGEKIYFQGLMVEHVDKVPDGYVLKQFPGSDYFVITHEWTSGEEALNYGIWAGWEFERTAQMPEGYVRYDELGLGSDFIISMIEKENLDTPNGSRYEHWIPIRRETAEDVSARKAFYDSFENAPPRRAPVDVDLATMTKLDGCDVRYEDGIMLLHADGYGYGSGVVTAEQFTGLIKIEARVKTDSHDIVLYYHDGCLNLNWKRDDNRNVLYFHDLFHDSWYEFVNKGRVPAGKFIDLVWVIGAEGMLLKIDGEVRTVGQDFKYVDSFKAGTPSPAPVRIATANGTTVAVESLRVTEIDDVTTIEDVIIRKLSGDMQENALDFVAFMKANAMKSDASHSSAFVYGDKWVCIIVVDDCMDGTMGWTIYDNPLCGRYEALTVEVDEDLQAFAQANVHLCGHFLSGGEHCGCGNQPGKQVSIFGKAFDNVCTSEVAFRNPDAEALEKIKRLIEIWKQAIDNGEESNG